MTTLSKEDYYREIAVLIQAKATTVVEENRCIDFTFEHDVLLNGEKLYIHATGKASVYGIHRGGGDEEMYFRQESSTTVLHTLTIMGEDQEPRSTFEMELINLHLDILNT